MKDVHISNPEVLEEKLRRIKEGGNTHFHVVSDFDRTLTPMFIDGVKAESGVGQIRAGGYLSPEYVKEAYALKDKYYPIEIDENVPIEERSKKMQEWWEAHLKVMIRYGLNKGVIEDIVKKRKIKPRQGSLEFYDILHKSNIPLLIFSAGKGDLIEGFLKEEGRLYDNIHIIANFYDYDKKGFVRGYKSGIIHTFNKNEGQITRHPDYEQIKKRRNVLVLGDSIGDLGMTEGLVHDTVLRIGFLNENTENLQKFSECFDVVILNDGPMDYVNNLLKKILYGDTFRWSGF
jgi:5'-nucleotidase